MIRLLAIVILTRLVSLAYAQSPMMLGGKGTPEIDGKIDAVWLTTPAAAIVRPDPASTTLPKGHGAIGTVRCLWEKQQLFFLFDVRDGQLHDENGAPWEQDSVEVFIDEDCGRSGGYQADDAHYRVSFRNQVTGGKNFDAQNIQSSVAMTDSGYLVEMAVKLRNRFGHNGARVGIDFQVNDDAGKGRRESLTKWSVPNNESWQSTSGHGKLVLKDKVSRGELVRAATKAVLHGLMAGGQGGAGPTKIEKKEWPVAPVPDWVKDAVFYQVFPERFRNGDPSNDPTHESLEFPDVIPKSWRISPWTGDWFARDAWEKESGDDFYENGVFNRRYGGDLQGVIDKLDYLADLGVTTIYFNPVFYARSLHKYDGNSFHHIDPHFGPDPKGDFAIMKTETSDPATWKWTAADKLFLELLKQARRRKLNVIIDGVFNHCGRDFFAFDDLRRNQKDSPYVAWYTVKSFDDPATPKSEFTYDCWWGVDTLPNFADTEDGSDLHPGPKEYILNATRRWMDPNGDGNPEDGIAGWRLDVANEVPNKFWRDWHKLVRELNPDAYTVAEIWSDAREYLGRTGFTATMNYHGFAFPTKGFLVDNKLKASQFAEEITKRRSEYAESTQYALQNLIDSHDTDRLASMIVNAGKSEYLRPARFDYDVGERCSSRHYPDYDVSKPTEKHRRIQRLVALWQMTYVGPPMIYYGTEAGMWGGDDPDDRMPMFWDDLETYATRKSHPLGRPRPSDEVAFDRGLYSYYRDLIALRKQSQALRRGSFEILKSNDDQSLLVFAREYEGEKLIVLLNRSEKTATASMTLSRIGFRYAQAERLFLTPKISLQMVQRDEYLRVSLGGTSGAVLRVK